MDALQCAVSPALATRSSAATPANTRSDAARAAGFVCLSVVLHQP
jgi:hypothetical protein